MHSKVFILQGVSCSSCVTKIEKTLSSLKGVHSIQLNFATSKLQLQFDSKSISLDEIKKKLIELGYPPESEELKKNKQATSETGSLVRLFGLQIHIFYAKPYIVPVGKAWGSRTW